MCTTSTLAQKPFFFKNEISSDPEQADLQCNENMYELDVEHGTA